ncbi:hypothetical protein [Actinoplanes solisilvae]|uniref:hypothetical protein n=1 Tax=Actinoplanes solisilvae TaxID=2486853 RepID=UPI000FD9C550|nr:hypothetical protein [Actinoplanes solisilvae]
MNDDLRRVSRARPPEIQGWAASDEGRAVLDGVLRETRRPSPAKRRNRIFAIVAGAVLATGAGGVAVANGLPFSDGDPSGGMCARTLSADADLSQPNEKFDPADPAKACAESWTVMFGDGTPRPASFVACRHPGEDAGGSVIYPAERFADAAAACASIGSRPIP